MADFLVSLIGFVHGVKSAPGPRLMNGLQLCGKRMGSTCSAQPSGGCFTGSACRTKKDLRASDVVILDNLPAHPSTTAADTLREIGAWFLFPPKYSPDLTPIEMAFSKLKALIRKGAARP